MNKNKVSILNGTEFNGVKIRCEIKSIPSLMDIDMGEFLEHARENDYHLISAEINDEATPLNRYKFDFSKHTCIVLGHEESGVPVELIRNSDSVFIPLHMCTFVVSIYCSSYQQWKGICCSR